MQGYFSALLILIIKLIVNVNGQECQQIRVPICSNLAEFHTKTMQDSELSVFGNQEDLLAILLQYESLISCSQDMRYFVCSALLPSCENSHLKYPCSSFCRRALSSESCQSELREIQHLDGASTSSFKSIFDCDLLYNESSDGNVCVSYESVKTATPTLPSNPLNTTVQFCKRNIHYSSSSKHFASVWLIITTIPTLLILLFAILTILFNLKLYEYPLRPVQYVVLCHIIFCCGVLLRSAIGYNLASCQEGEIIRGEYWTPQHAPCVVIFIMTYFGMTSYLVWTGILACTILLSKLFQWSDADIAKFNVIFHIVGWGVPTIPTLTLISLRESRADELTGICSVSAESHNAYLAGLIVPVLVYTVCTIAGFLLSIGGIFRTFRRMGFYQKHLEKRKTICTLIRIGTFLLAYTFIYAIFITLTLYEYIASSKYTEVSCRGVNCRFASPVTGIIRFTCILASGWATVIWVTRPSIISRYKKMATKITNRKSNKKLPQLREIVSKESNYNIGEVTNLGVRVPGFVDISHACSYEEYLYSIPSTTTITTTTTNKSQDQDMKQAQPTITRWEIPQGTSICSTTYKSITTV